jgi:hypothetical protein
MPRCDVVTMERELFIVREFFESCCEIEDRLRAFLPYRIDDSHGSTPKLRYETKQRLCKRNYRGEVLGTELKPYIPMT